MPLAISGTYSYNVPDNMDNPQIGMRVIVPLGNKELIGLVYRYRTDLLPDNIKLRDIICIPDSRPVVTKRQIQLWEWIAEYYMCSLGEVMSAALPSKVNDRQYLLDGSTKRKVNLREYSGEIQDMKTLTSAQSQALNDIRDSWNKNDVTLLHGVTSSGKTEVYIHLISEQLKQKKQVLYLVPEIALTTQLTDRLQQIFGNQLYVYHSRISDAQRMEIYRRVLDNTEDGKLLVGARSALFLPLSNLGMIIVDEEHEHCYKQQDPAPRYHARSVSLMLARWFDAKVLLGSATPSIESMFNAVNGKYALVELNQRYQGLQLPDIQTINLGTQYHRKEMYDHFADPLVEQINQTLSDGKQVILFQNRRGYAPYIQCTQCGDVPKCPNCDVSMTLHKSARMLACHYCGQNTFIPSICQKCGGEMKVHGFGTERIEEEVAKLFPQAKIGRMDLDTTRKKNDYQDIINAFSNHELDILIGTQMVSKGLDFNDVQLVAILNADPLLNQPDFRSYERAFQMMEQVSGRAGRKGKQGHVVIQTFNPHHYIFHLVQDHDYRKLYTQQIEERQSFNYPPFSRIVDITLKHKNMERLEQAASQLHARIKLVFGNRCSDVIIPSITRTNNLYIRRIRLHIETKGNISRAKQLLQRHIDYVLALPECKGIIILPDVDPL